MAFCGQVYSVRITILDGRPSSALVNLLTISAIAAAPISTPPQVRGFLFFNQRIIDLHGFDLYTFARTVCALYGLCLKNLGGERKTLRG